MLSIQEQASFHTHKTTAHPTPAAKAFVEALLSIGVHATQSTGPAPARDTVSDILKAWDSSQLQYINQRAREYGQNGEWLASQLPTDILRNPDAAVDALNKAGELPGMQLEHIISQANAPHLAKEADNIILAPADNFNQKLGRTDMTTQQVAERAEAAAEYFDVVRDTHNTIPEPAFTFEECWAAFSEFTRGPLRLIFAFQYVDKATWRSTIRLGQRIVNDMPKVKDQATRRRMLNDVTRHINHCAGSADIHTAFLMFLLIGSVPWAAPLLAAKGLASLAKLVINSAQPLTDFVKRKAGNTWAAGILRAAKRGLTQAIYLFDTVVSNCWKLVETTVAAAGDILASVYRASASVITSIWQGACSLASFFSPHSQAYA